MDLFLQREGRLKFLILKGGFGSMFSGIIYHLITVQGIVSDMGQREILFKQSLKVSSTVILVIIIRK